MIPIKEENPSKRQYKIQLWLQKSFKRIGLMNHVYFLTFTVDAATHLQELYQAFHWSFQAWASWVRHGLLFQVAIAVKPAISAIEVAFIVFAHARTFRHIKFEGLFMWSQQTVHASADSALKHVKLFGVLRSSQKQYDVSLTAASKSAVNSRCRHAVASNCLPKLVRSVMKNLSSALSSDDFFVGLLQPF